MVREIALIADLHGNMPAVRALEKDLERRGIRDVYCLGDLVGKGPSSAETCDWAFTHCKVVIQGNWDNGIAEKLFPNDRFFYEQLGPERMERLRTLPTEHVFGLSGRRIRLIHGRPVMKTLLSPTAETALLSPLFDPDYDVVGYADAHRQGLRMVGTRGILLNTGAVGNGLGVTMVQYALLKGDDEDSAAPLDISFVTLPYDREAAVRETEAALGLPNGQLFMDELRTGIYRRGKSKQR